MINDLKRRLRNLEGRAGSVVTVSAAAIAAAVERYRAALDNCATPTVLPSADTFGTMLRSMRPATAVLFLGCDPEDLLL